MRRIWPVALVVCAALGISGPCAQSGPSTVRARATAGPAVLPAEGLARFVEIPAGPFVMGSDRAVDPMANDNERWATTTPQGTVELPAFFIARHEVTIAQFQAFVEATRFKVDDRALRGQPRHPVAFVSWPDALVYCRWLEATLKAWPETPARLGQLLRDGWRVSLPSEAQWEKAARGADRRIFPWGNQPRRDRANFQSTGTTPVGAFDCPECPYPLSDMSGNVWEWTRSPYQPYPYDENDDRSNLEADALWVIRGGHFADSLKYMRTAARGAADPGVRRAFIGFRVAITTLSR